MLRQEGLTRHDRMKVIEMASEFWEWLAAFMDKSTERVRAWRMKNEERKKELARKASAAYWERKKENDPEYVEKRRQANAKRMRRIRKPIAELSPEEQEIQRAKKREEMRRYREKLKAKKLAEQKMQENGTA